MGKAYLFYNPLAGGGKILEDLDALEFVLDTDTVLCDMTDAKTYEQTLFAMTPEDYIVVCGGDGTLHRFWNLVADLGRSNAIYYYPAGTHNDFALNFGRFYGCNPFPVTEFLGKLPVMRTEKRTACFLTGILFLTDDRKRSHFPKQAGYDRGNTPVDLQLRIDGCSRSFEKVSFAAILKGRYCCGGKAPDPDRRWAEEELSCVIIHGCGKWKAARLKRRLWKNRPLHSSHLTLYRGRDVEMLFEDAVCLRVDGELHTEVTQLYAAAEREEKT